MVVVVVIIERVRHILVVVQLVKLAAAHVRRMRVQVLVVGAYDVTIRWAPRGRVATVRAGHAIRIGRVRRAEIRVRWMVVVRVHGSGCGNSGQFELFSANRKTNVLQLVVIFIKFSIRI